MPMLKNSVKLLIVLKFISKTGDNFSTFEVKMKFDTKLYFFQSWIANPFKIRQMVTEIIWQMYAWPSGVGSFFFFELTLSKML